MHGIKQVFSNCRRRAGREGGPERSILSIFQGEHLLCVRKQSLYKSVAYVTHSFSSFPNHSTSIYSLMKAFSSGHCYGDSAVNDTGMGIGPDLMEFALELKELICITHF